MRLFGKAIGSRLLKFSSSLPLNLLLMYHWWCMSSSTSNMAHWDLSVIWWRFSDEVKSMADVYNDKDDLIWSKSEIGKFTSLYITCKELTLPLPPQSSYFWICYMSSGFSWLFCLILALMPSRSIGARGEDLEEYFLMIWMTMIRRCSFPLPLVVVFSNHLIPIIRNLYSSLNISCLSKTMVYCQNVQILSFLLIYPS